MNLDISPGLLWFLIGLLLMLAEIPLPGIILMFFGAGAWVAALTTWFGWTDSLTSQLVVFTIASLVLLVLLRRTVKARFLGYTGDEKAGLQDMDEFAGVSVPVLKDVGPDGREGRVEFKGAHWRAVSRETLPKGSQAVIVKVEGIVLHIRAHTGEESS